MLSDFEDEADKDAAKRAVLAKNGQKNSIAHNAEDAEKDRDAQGRLLLEMPMKKEKSKAAITTGISFKCP